MPRKIPTTFTVELDQLERLTEVAARTRINRSIIVREGIELALARYARAEQASQKVSGERVRRGGGAVGALARRP